MAHPRTSFATTRSTFPGGGVVAAGGEGGGETAADEVGETDGAIEGAVVADFSRWAVTGAAAVGAWAMTALGVGAPGLRGGQGSRIRRAATREREGEQGEDDGRTSRALEHTRTRIHQHHAGAARVVEPGLVAERNVFQRSHRPDTLGGRALPFVFGYAEESPCAPILLKEPSL